MPEYTLRDFWRRMGSLKGDLAMLWVAPSSATTAVPLGIAFPVPKSERKICFFTTGQSLSYTRTFIFDTEESLRRVAISWRRVFEWARIPIVVLATAFPVVFAKHIESRELTYVVVFILVVAGAAVAEHYYDRAVASQLENARRRLQMQTAAGPTMARLLEVVSQLRATLQQKASLTPDQRAAVAKNVEESIVEVLKALCANVWSYWNSSGSTEGPFFGSVMRAYETNACDAATLAKIKERTKFIGYGRDLASYKHVLDVLFWSDTSPQFTPVAIPVEDENSDRGRKRLLPGAPTAYALGEDVIISDMRYLPKYSGLELEEDLLQQEREYFDQKKIRSMVCLVIRATRDKKLNQNRIGVLNIHSDKVNLLGSSEQEQKTIIQNLEHYRVALEYLLDGQQQLAS